MKASLKWQRALPIYKPDNIVSSKAREVGDYGFKPKYETEPKPKMRFIMSNEYMRLWFAERDVYQKENYSKQETSDDNKYRRRFVQRMMTYKKKDEKELPIIELKRFQNIAAKVDSWRKDESKRKTPCERYKKSFETAENVRYKPECHGKTNTSSKKKTNKEKYTGETHDKLKQEIGEEENSNETDCK